LQCRRSSRIGLAFLELARLTGRIARAPGRILHLAALGFGAAICRQIPIPHGIADDFLDATFELMTDSSYAIVIHAGHYLRMRTRRTGLGGAKGSLRGAVRGKFCIANDSSQSFLQPTLQLVAESFNPFICHDLIPS
jgi:hypothetical protein